MANDVREPSSGFARLGGTETMGPVLTSPILEDHMLKIAQKMAQNSSKSLKILCKKVFVGCPTAAWKAHPRSSAACVAVAIPASNINGLSLVLIIVRDEEQICFFHVLGSCKARLRGSELSISCLLCLLLCTKEKEVLKCKAVPGNFAACPEADMIRVEQRSPAPGQRFCQLCLRQG